MINARPLTVAPTPTIEETVRWPASGWFRTSCPFMWPRELSARAEQSSLDRACLPTARRDKP